MEVTSIKSRDQVKNSKASKMIHMFLKKNEIAEGESEVFSKTKAEVRYFYVPTVPFRRVRRHSHFCFLFSFQINEGTVVQLKRLKNTLKKSTL